MRVELLWSPAPREVLSVELDLPEGSRISDAVAASGWAQRYPELSPLPGAGLGVGLGVGIWGRKAPPHQVLQDGDRVEIYRPLRVDPKVARRERFATQGARSAGLFARRRPGGKPGY